MKYTDITLDQRISLKGVFQTDKRFVNYGMIMLSMGWRTAIEYFFNDDISELYTRIDNQTEMVLNKFV